MPTSLTPARPGTAAAAAPRHRRVLVALGLAAALTGGGLVATAPDASAAPVGAAVHTATSAKKTPSARFSVSKYTMVKNSGSKRPAYTMIAKNNGKAFPAAAKLVMNGKVVATKRMQGGKAVFKPYWSKYRLGTNTVRVVVDPTPSKLASKSSRTVKVKATKPSASRSAKIVKVAQQQVGDRYRYGASGPHAFDCSGLTKYVYKKATGKTLPRSSSAQKAAGKVVSRKNARPGDLIWTPGHVAIYVGNGKQVEAARPGVGVVKRSIWQDNPRFVRI